MPGQAQFRQPLPPNAGNVRLMNPQMGQVPQQGQQMRPGQVSSGNPMSMPTRPGTFLLVQRQPSNPARARMMMVQQGQPGQHPPPGGQPQVGGPPHPQVSQSSPLLAQHLAGRMPTPQQQQQQVQPGQQGQVQPQQGQVQPQQGQVPPQQGQQSQPEGGAQGQQPGASEDDLPNELGDLGVAEEDLLGMSDNFDILEFADALDDLENVPDDGNADGDTPASGASSGAPTSGATSVTSTGATASTTPTTPSSGTVTTPATQPPPYSKAPTNQGLITNPQAGGAPIRGPPPPYPGQQGPPVPGQPSQLPSKVLDLKCLIFPEIYSYRASFTSRNICCVSYY